MGLVKTAFLKGSTFSVQWRQLRHLQWCYHEFQSEGLVLEEDAWASLHRKQQRACKVRYFTYQRDHNWIWDLQWATTWVEVVQNCSVSFAYTVRMQPCRFHSSGHIQVTVSPFPGAKCIHQ